MNFTLRGMRETQDAMRQAIAQQKPSGSLGHAVQWGTLRAQRYASSIAPRRTGSLAASIVPEMVGDLRGLVFISPLSVNPKTGDRPADYGPRVHDMGGHRAFFERTVMEAGPEIGTTMFKIWQRGMP